MILCMLKDKWRATLGEVLAGKRRSAFFSEKCPDSSSEGLYTSSIRGADFLFFVTFFFLKGESLSSLNYSVFHVSTCLGSLWYFASFFYGVR